MPEEPPDFRLRAVLRLAREVTARRDLDDVLAQAMRGLRAMVSFTGGSIQLIDEEGWITVAAAEPAAPEEVMERRIPLGASLAGRVILTEQAVYAPDTASDPQADASQNGEVRSYFAVPLLVDGRAIGMLRVDASQPGAFGESDQLLIAAIATIVAAAIQNARAHARVAIARKSTERFVTL